MTYLELRTVDADAFATLAMKFRVLAVRLRGRADTMRELRMRLVREWTGPAAWAARNRGGGLCRRLVEVSTVVSRADQILVELARRLDRAKALLADAERLAADVGAPIDAAGHAYADATGTPSGAATASVCTTVDRQIESALHLAQEADRAAADALQSLTTLLIGLPPPGLAGLGQPALTGAELAQVEQAGLEQAGLEQAGLGQAGSWSGPVGLPGAGTTAQEVAGYWANLTAPQRWWLMTNRSATVGGLDGIPAADRDTANRLLLASERERLSALRNSTSDPPPLVEVEHLDGQLRGLDAIDARLRDPAQAPAYLLQLSTVDDGRAVIAAGDPDRATDVLTYVPGTGADLSGVDTLVARSDAVSQTAVRLAPAHEVSVVTWLGYDPPDSVAAISPTAGYHAEPALDAFMEGLRATHIGQPSHNTVLGHSYGSLVAGLTARDRGLDADDVIFVGSPGVGVDRAADLDLPPSAVWSSTAADDPVQRFAPGWQQLATDVVADVVRPFSAWYGDSTPDQMLWYGRNPSTPAFGGQVFASDPDGGHSGYWKGAALDAITRIAVNLDAPPP